jgi:hypothetical protein
MGAVVSPEAIGSFLTLSEHERLYLKNSHEQSSSLKNSDKFYGLPNIAILLERAFKK